MSCHLDEVYGFVLHRSVPMLFSRVRAFQVLVLAGLYSCLKFLGSLNLFH